MPIFFPPGRTNGLPLICSVPWLRTPPPCPVFVRTPCGRFFFSRLPRSSPPPSWPSSVSFALQRPPTSTQSGPAISLFLPDFLSIVTFSRFGFFFPFQPNAFCRFPQAPFIGRSECVPEHSLLVTPMLFYVITAGLDFPPQIKLVVSSKSFPLYLHWRREP